MIDLISSEDLARRLGFSGATNAFREWCAHMGIVPVPRRRGFYDPKHVRMRLDAVQGLAAAGQGTSGGDRPMSLVQQRKARHGTA